MGLFSRCTSDTQKSISVYMNGYEGAPKRVYLLNPFGDAYQEERYGGYGMFGGQDVYALVAKWNAPEKCKDENGEWLPDDDIRDIGIELACYDEDHVQLQFPIKIVENLCSYEQAGISPQCPFQGHFYPECPDEIKAEVEEAFMWQNGAMDALKFYQNIGENTKLAIEKLKFDSNEVRDQVFLTFSAKYKKCPQEVLMEIGRHGDIYLAQKLVKNANLSLEVLNELKKWDSEYMQRMILKHPNYKEEKLSLDDRIAKGVHKVSGKFNESRNEQDLSRG